MKQKLTYPGLSGLRLPAVKNRLSNLLSRLKLKRNEELAEPKK
jgi:hypothetical protein